MKINFKDEAQFAKLEDKAIDGALIYDDFPPEEYKYFSKLSKLGYNNRHKGWSVEICQAKQEEYKQQYYKEKSYNNRFTELYRQVHQNILTSSEITREMYKTNDKEQMLSLALQAIENMTQEDGFVKRIIKNVKESDIT